MDIAARPGQVPPLIVASVRRESVIASGAACYRLHYLRIGRQRSMTIDRPPPSAATADREPSLTVSRPPTSLTAPFLRHLGGPLATVLADPLGCPGARRCPSSAGSSSSGPRS